GKMEDGTGRPWRSWERCQTNMRSLVKPDKERILPCAELFGTPLPTRCSPRRHFDDELHEIVRRLSRRHERPKILQVAPAQWAVRAVWDQAHFVFRAAHLNLDKALEEGRLVVIEGRRQDIPRKRPAAEVFPPEPKRLFPHRGLRVEFGRDRIFPRIVSPDRQGRRGGPIER